MSNLWLRLYADTPEDPKLIGIAANANVPMIMVFGIWTYLLCRARKNEKPGTFNETPQEIANVLECDVLVVEEVLGHFNHHVRSLLNGNKICKWEKYQKSYDMSNERVAKFRAAQAQAAGKAPKNPPKSEPIQRPADLVTLHRPNKNPNVSAAASLGKKIMMEKGVYGKIEFNQMTSCLTPLIEEGIPEEFIESAILRMWASREARNGAIKTLSYFVGGVKQEWENAHMKLEGTNGNVKQPIRTGSSRNTGEDIASRRQTILEELGFASEVDSLRTGSF